MSFEITSDILQVFVAEKPDTPLFPRRSNPLVNKIDQTKVASAVVSGVLLKKVADRELLHVLPFGVPAVGDVIVSVEVNNEKIKVFAEADISNIK